MLRLILIVEGLLIMMRQHTRSEALFYYFRLEDQVPEHHLLRLIDMHISFDFVRHAALSNSRDSAFGVYLQYQYSLARLRCWHSHGRTLQPSCPGQYHRRRRFFCRTGPFWFTTPAEETGTN